jgi:long-chain acyl-CoA synthetase
MLADCGARVLVVHADLLSKVQDCLPSGIEVLVVETPAEIAAAYRIEAGACEVPHGRTNWEVWRAAQRELERPSDIPGSTMLYTSGTTGHPKGVRRHPLPDSEMATYYQVIGDGFGLEPGARVVMTGPMYHSAPLAHATVSLLYDSDIFLMPRFDAQELLALIERERITHMHVVPTMMVRMMKLPENVRNAYDVSSLRVVMHGAAPCSHEIKRAMIEWWGPVIREYYGSTEASVISVCSSEEFLKRPGTVGRPQANATVVVVDEQGEPVGPGEIGELYARLGGAPDFDYHNRKQERRDIDRDGLLTNGDLGYLDEDGYLFICDRKRDMVISGGVNIYPAEIESVLITHTLVLDCAVFGIPDEDFGESLTAIIEPEPGTTLDASTIETFLRSRLARYKVPRHIEFRADLPRLDNGKIYKRKLRDPYWRSVGRKI